MSNSIYLVNIKYINSFLCRHAYRHIHYTRLFQLKCLHGVLVHTFLFKYERVICSIPVVDKRCCQWNIHVI